MPLSSQMVHERLRATAARVRWSRGARGVILGLAAAAVCLTLFMIGDAYAHFGAVMRWGAFLLTFSSLAAGVAAAWRAWRAPVSEAAAARRIEASCPGAGNALISAVQFDARLAADSPLRAALFEEMRNPFPNVDWGQVFDLSRLKRVAFALGAAVTILFLWAVIKPAYFANSAARLLFPAKEIAPFTRTRIVSLSPGDVRLVNGQDLAVSVTFGGESPKSAWLWRREAGSGWHKTLMDHEAGRAAFSKRWQDIRASTEYYIEAGDARTPVHRVTIRPRTAIRSRSAEIAPPAYAVLGKSELRDFTALTNVLAGSRVTLTLEWTHPLAELHAAPAGQGQPLRVERLSDARWRVDLGAVMASETIRLDYRDTDLLADAASVPMNIRADKPPEIHLIAPVEGRELALTPDGEWFLQFTAADDFALGSLALYRSADANPAAQLVREWKEAAGQKTFSAQARVALRDFIPAGSAGSEDQRLTFCIVAKDRNDVTGPGTTISRPIVITLRSPEALRQQAAQAGEKIRQGLTELIKLQKTNLALTRAANHPSAAPGDKLADLLARQIEISDLGAGLATTAGTLAPETRSLLRSLADGEMKDAVLALRDAAASVSNNLTRAIGLQAVILARLQGMPADADEEGKRTQAQDLISGVEDLLRKQREILRETSAAPSANAAPALSSRQDALSDQAGKVRKTLQAQARNAAAGDRDFRARLEKAAGLFGELRVYEEMLVAADKLQSAAFASAVALQKNVTASLARIVGLLNEWQIAQADERADLLRKEAEAMKKKLDQLAALQQSVIEKSKELARKDQFSPADQATADQIKAIKEKMAQLVEQMLIDAHVFPDLKPSNELRSELTSIYEDVIQTDKNDAAEGKLKPQEIAVQKEDSLLQGIEQAKKISEDLEMWLPNHNETQKWLMENFDKSEMPEIPNLPLPDAFEDIVGKLLDEQQKLAEQVQDTASNQAFADNPANGWEIRDGPMPGFGAQGKSGNERPNKNEQTGRSSGGREGMSDGEMVGDTASKLEGTKPDARRTNDPLQQGQVKDTGGANETLATGGGKASGFSDRAGMDGKAPLRSTSAPVTLAKDALAAQQAQLAQKTSRTYAAANLLYMKTGAMPEVTRLMKESETALREGRAGDFANYHRRIVGRLNEVKGGIVSGGAALALPASDTSRGGDQQFLGGSEGGTPARYKDAVADYYRSLTDEKK